MRPLGAGGAGADGANSSFRRRMLSMSIYAWSSVKPFYLTSDLQIATWEDIKLGIFDYIKKNIHHNAI